jgi:SAM-dependent methyltransferase
MKPLEALRSVLRCPDDGSELRLSGLVLECFGCGRCYPVLAENVVELLPSSGALTGAGSAYGRDYAAARAAPFEWREDTLAWGAPESFPSKWVERKHRQVAAVERLIPAGAFARDLFCDFSAGAGYYTLEYAKAWRYVIHCDLSVDSLTYARRKAASRGLRNILFLRMDYLRPAFRRSLECVACLDSLIRGKNHERLLLRAIRGSLAPGGSAVVDFHNWWHNPIRRLGLLRNNFGGNRSYREREIRGLLASAGISGFERFAFHQELSPDCPGGGVVRTLLPPTRWMYRFGAG